jgi:hypothetical protein
MATSLRRFVVLLPFTIVTLGIAISVATLLLSFLWSEVPRLT